MSSICSSAHHPALFFIHSGILSSETLCVSTGGICIILFSIKYSKAEINSTSSIFPSDHHFAMGFTHSGMVVGYSLSNPFGFSVYVYGYFKITLLTNSL